jgi:hypothetical protein
MTTAMNGGRSSVTKSREHMYSSGKINTAPTQQLPDAIAGTLELSTVNVEPTTLSSATPGAHLA